LEVVWPHWETAEQFPKLNLVWFKKALEVTGRDRLAAVVEISRYQQKRLGGNPDELTDFLNTASVLSFLVGPGGPRTSHYVPMHGKLEPPTS